MKLKFLLVVNAIFFLINGICALLIPGTVLSLYGVSPGPEQNIMEQYAGMGSIAIALITWLSRNIADPVAKRTIIPALLIYFVIGVIVSLLGTISDVMNSFGWSLVFIYLFFASGYAYHLIRKPLDL